MTFDPRNSSWYSELDEKSKRVLRNSRPKIDKQFKNQRKMRLIMNMTGKLLDPIENCCFKYLEENTIKLTRSNGEDELEQVKQEIKAIVKERFVFNYKRVCTLGFGVEVHDAIYEMYRNKKMSTFQKEIYTMIQSIASELIKELKREEQGRTIGKGPFGSQLLKDQAN